MRRPVGAVENGRHFERTHQLMCVARDKGGFEIIPDLREPRLADLHPGRR